MSANNNVKPVSSEEIAAARGIKNTATSTAPKAETTSSNTSIQAAKFVNQKNLSDETIAKFFSKYGYINHQWLTEPFAQLVVYCNTKTIYVSDFIASVVPLIFDGIDLDCQLLGVSPDVIVMEDIAAGLLNNIKGYESARDNFTTETLKSFKSDSIVRAYATRELKSIETKQQFDNLSKMFGVSNFADIETRLYQSTPHKEK